MLPNMQALFVNVNLGDYEQQEFRRLSAEFEQQLLIERNANWMTHILEIKDQTAVIAVGVGHFSDEHGLLNQLEQAGYSLTRAEF